MKIYIAARYSKKYAVRAFADALRERAQAEITSRWHAQAESDEGDAFLSDPSLGAPYALIDLEDIRAADWLILLTEDPKIGTPRGGRHVEFGYALALDKKVAIVGPRENIFHTLDSVVMFPDIDHALTAFEFVSRLASSAGQ